MRRASLAALVFMAALGPGLASAQAARAVPRSVPRGEAVIPDAPFRSWSLFLVCNADWLRPQRAGALRDLYERWHAFGRTTGDLHAAVWFYIRRLEPTAEEVDVERSVRYCQKFGLKPREGPHIVVTTVHPDRWRPGGVAGTAADSLVVVALGGAAPERIQKYLDALQDQALVHRLSQAEIDSLGYWQSWLGMLEAGCRFLAGAKFTVDAKVVRVEKTGLCG